MLYTSKINKIQFQTDFTEQVLLLQSFGISKKFREFN